ncbi:MAG TPA: hypothetical protein VEL06_02800 [Haliangiales bacterium]|nr:hypothetical protein [Haliangiales bacterium]
MKPGKRDGSRTRGKVQQAIASAIRSEERCLKQRVSRWRRFTKMEEKIAGSEKEAAELRVLELLGLDRKRLDASRRARARVMSDELRKRLREHLSPRRIPLPAWINVVPPPLSDEPLKFPVCLFPAQGCTPSGGTSCDAAHATLRLSSTSSGLGGNLGLFAVASMPPVSGSLWYGFMSPVSGVLSVTAHLVLSGFMAIYTSTGGSWILNALSTVEASAELVMRISVHQTGNTQQTERVISLRGHGDVIDYVRFDRERWTMTLNADVGPAEPVVIRVRAELYAFGRSDYASSLLLFNGSVHGGISVPALCLSFVPHFIL